jgi:hypothetical protein
VDVIGKGQKSQKRARVGTLDTRICGDTHARASWNATRTLSTAASVPQRYPPRHSVGVGWTDGRANGGEGSDTEPVVVRTRVRIRHLHYRGGAGASGGAMVVL